MRHRTMEFRVSVSRDGTALVEEFTGLLDATGKRIYENDIVYLAGYGNYHCEFPFIELYEHSAEGDIGDILGNVHCSPELLET